MRPCTHLALAHIGRWRLPMIRAGGSAPLSLGRCNRQFSTCIAIVGRLTVLVCEWPRRRNAAEMRLRNYMLLADSEKIRHCFQKPKCTSSRRYEIQEQFESTYFSPNPSSLIELHTHCENPITSKPPTQHPYTYCPPWDPPTHPHAYAPTHSSSYPSPPTSSNPSASPTAAEHTGQKSSSTGCSGGIAATILNPSAHILIPITLFYAHIVSWQDWKGGG
jgi:hypothetical protein